MDTGRVDVAYPLDKDSQDSDPSPAPRQRRRLYQKTRNAVEGHYSARQTQVSGTSTSAISTITITSMSGADSLDRLHTISQHINNHDTALAQHGRPIDPLVATTPHNSTVATNHNNETYPINTDAHNNSSSSNSSAESEDNDEPTSIPSPGRLLRRPMLPKKVPRPPPRNRSNHVLIESSKPYDNNSIHNCSDNIPRRTTKSGPISGASDQENKTTATIIDAPQPKKRLVLKRRYVERYEVTESSDSRSSDGKDDGSNSTLSDSDSTEDSDSDEEIELLQEGLDDLDLPIAARRAKRQLGGRSGGIFVGWTRPKSEVVKPSDVVDDEDCKSSSEIIALDDTSSDDDQLVGIHLPTFQTTTTSKSSIPKKIVDGGGTSTARATKKLKIGTKTTRGRFRSISPLSTSQPPLLSSLPGMRLHARNRAELATRLYTLFNRAVFQDQLPVGMKLSWSKTLNRTAGRTHYKTWKGQKSRNNSNNNDNNSSSNSSNSGDGDSNTLTESITSLSTYREKEEEQQKREQESRDSIWIELSTKVISTLQQLECTLAHEMCHAATMVISGMYKNPHGKIFKTWATKVMNTFPESDLEIRRCHNYEIRFKYQWRCSLETCEVVIKRHSKSLDVTKVVCGRCKSRFRDVEKIS